MTTVIKGTLNEVLEHLHGLSLPPDMRISVTMREETDTVQEKSNPYADLEQKYANWPRRHGILQIPSNQPLTIDEINDLRDG